jgi:hypothetical protein
MTATGHLSDGGLSGRDWVAALPADMTGQQAILGRLLDLCDADESIRWLSIACSVSRGAGDGLSDLDIGIGVRAADGEFDAACEHVHRAVDGLGELVESFAHQLPRVPFPHVRIFAQYADRCQIDLVVAPAAAEFGKIPHVVTLYDPDGTAPPRAGEDEPPTPAQVREWAFLGWSALADLGKYLRRGSLWEAYGRLGAARDQAFAVQAAAGRVPQAQYGLTSILDFAPATLEAEMAETVAGLDLAAILAAARRLARLLEEAGGRLDPARRAAFPAAMGRFIRADLDGLAAQWAAAGGPHMGAPARA